MTINKSMAYSIVLHIVLLLLVVIGLPSFFSKKDVLDSAITVEILPISELTNVAPKKAPPKAEPKKEVTSATKPKQSMADPNKKPEPIVAPEPAKPEPKKEAEIKEKEVAPLVKPKPPEEKKPEKKKEEKKQETKEDNFASVLKSVEEMNVKDEPQEKEEEKADFGDIEDLLAKSDSQPEYKPGAPMSLSDKDAVRQQVMQNWSLSSVSGAKDAQNMVVTLNIKVAVDGTVQDVEIKDKMRYNTDSFYKAMADSAVRAVLKSSPLKGLPPEKYDVKDGWREMEMNFDPREMFY